MDWCPSRLRGERRRTVPTSRRWRMEDTDNVPASISSTEADASLVSSLAKHAAGRARADYHVVVLLARGLVGGGTKRRRSFRPAGNLRAASSALECVQVLLRRL